MRSRRGFLIKLSAGFAAMALVIVGSVIADELIGAITKVDVDAKKLTVVEKDTDKEVTIKVTDETEIVTKKGTDKLDLEKLDGRVKKFEDAGKKVMAKITHEKKVASKIEYLRKKKAE